MRIFEVRNFAYAAKFRIENFATREIFDRNMPYTGIFQWLVGEGIGLGPYDRVPVRLGRDPRPDYVWFWDNWATVDTAAGQDDHTVKSQWSNGRDACDFHSGHRSTRIG